MKKLFILFLVAQSILMYAQTDDSWKIYDDSHVGRVDITIHPDTLEWIYNNVESDIEHMAIVKFTNNNITETIDSIGFRLKGNTSRTSAKKSFKVSFNTFVEGRMFHGIQKLDLNGEHNDPSIIRSKLCFDLYKDLGIKASRANHMKVFINGNYYGLYVNVEHIDDEFLWKNFSDDSGNLWKCLYPADLKYLGSNPTTYQNLGGAKPAYELKTNEEEANFTKLAHLIDVINNTSSSHFQDSLENNIDISEVLRYLAMNVLVGGWDDYRSLMNNYYLYHTPTENRFHLIPYDYDNTFGVDWFNIDWDQADPYDWPKVVSGSRPLSDKMLAINQYRDLYTHFLEFISQNVYDLSQWENRLNATKDMITPAAQADLYRTYDYGFTMDDFNDSYTSGNYNNQHVKSGIKEFVNNRTSSLISQLSYKNAAPIIYNIQTYPQIPGENDSIYVYAACYSHVGLNEVTLHYQVSGISGSSAISMQFKPIIGSKKVEDNDRWVAVIPPISGGKTISLTISLTDNLNQTGSYPRVKPIIIKTPLNGGGEVRINELMASNTKTIKDPAGEYDDWVELYNPGSTPILLTGKYLTDKLTNLSKWKFESASLYINAGEHLLVWCDEDQSQTGLHTNFKLSASGEDMALVAEDGVSIIDALTFGELNTDVSYGRYPDGDNNLQTMPPTPGQSNKTIGMEELANQLDIKLSMQPNPAKNNASIRINLAQSQLITIKLFDEHGYASTVLPETYLNQGQHLIPIANLNLQAGVYILQAIGKNHVASTRLVLLK